MTVGKAANGAKAPATTSRPAKTRTGAPSGRTSPLSKPRPSRPTAAAQQAREGAKPAPSRPAKAPVARPTRATTPSATPPTGGKGGLPIGGTKAGGASQEEVRATAEATVRRAEDYFRTTFGRDGHDGAGGTVEVTLDPTVIAEARPATSTEPARIAVGRIKDPGSLTSRSVAGDADVITHEYTHLVIFSEAAPAPDRRNSRDYIAIHEGISDVFGAAIERDWQLAQVRNPSTGEGVVTTTTEARQGRVDPHERGGILSNAAADIQQQLGWEVMEQAFYAAITHDSFSSGSSMNQVAALVVAGARREGGNEAAEVALRAFRDNGLLLPRPNPNVR